MVARLVVVATLALLGGGCTSDVDPPPRVELNGVSTAPSVSTIVTEGWGIALLIAVSAVSKPAYDRVTFEFRNHAPGYDVRYVARPVRADGSGAEVKVRGDAVLLVRMEPALDADLSRESTPPTYTGPQRLVPDTPIVEELIRTGGFEAVLTWAIGVDAQRPFRVLRLRDPARLVIDVATGVG